MRWTKNNIIINKYIFNYKYIFCNEFIGKWAVCCCHYGGNVYSNINMELILRNPFIWLFGVGGEIRGLSNDGSLPGAIYITKLPDVRSIHMGKYDVGPNGGWDGSG